MEEADAEEGRACIVASVTTHATHIYTRAHKHRTHMSLATLLGAGMILRALHIVAPPGARTGWGRCERVPVPRRLLLMLFGTVGRYV